MAGGGWLLDGSGNARRTCWCRGRATLSRPRLLRQAASGFDRGRFRSVRGGAVCLGLCTAPRPSIAAAGTLLPYAADRLRESLDSERGLEWRCADSLSLREFLCLSERERVPDHSWLSRTR